MSGYIANDIREVKQKDGGSIANFSMSVKSNPNAEKQFIDCVAFSGMAQIAIKYLKKGSFIIVSGYLHIDTYTPKDSNISVKKARVVATSIEMVSNYGSQKKEEPNQQSQPTQPNKEVEQPAYEGVISEDDLPF